MTRGEVWWAALELPAGRRPVVLLSRQSAYTVRSSVTVAEITTVIRSIPSEVTLTKRDGLPKVCVVNTDNLHTIPRDRLETRISALGTDQLAQLDDALRFSLGLA